MSDTTASLRRKIDSAGNLQSVVRTMKALAASSIGQYEHSVRALGDYDRTVELGFGVCFRAAGSAALSQGVPKKYGRNRENRSERIIDALRTHLVAHRPLYAELRGTIVAV